MEQYHFTNDESGTEGWASFASGASFYADLDVAKQESIFDVSWPIGDEGFDVTHATPAPLGRSFITARPSVACCLPDERCHIRRMGHHQCV
jgi:hypothetical protein